MPNTSAGLLMYRYAAGGLEVLLAHPGGPFFARKDAGSWTLPKGLIDDDEDALAAARREFDEETGFPTPEDGYVPLGEIRQKGGKLVRGWAFEGDADPGALDSNTFELEYPPRSGKRATFPEVDRVAWLDLAAARAKINPAQVPFLERLEAAL